MKQQRGGRRAGAGRPKGIETKILTIRVCKVIHDELKAMVKCKDDEFRQNNYRDTDKTKYKPINKQAKIS